MIRSTNESPSGLVWSKKPCVTMSLEWPVAALRSLALSLSSGRPFWTRIWLCRQRIAARTSSTLSGVGIRSVFWHVIGACEVFAFGLAEALAFAVFVRLSPRAILAITGLSFFLAFASAAGAA